MAGETYKVEKPCGNEAEERALIAQSLGTQGDIRMHLPSIGDALHSCI